MTKIKHLAVALSLSILLLLVVSCSKTAPTVNSESTSANRSEIHQAEKSDRKEKDGKDTINEIIEDELAKTHEQIQTNKILASMTSKHNALIRWPQELRREPMIYTLDLQQAWVREDKRPILFFGFMLDVSADQGKYFVELQLLSLLASVSCLIECSADQVKSILDQKVAFGDECAVIASMSSVQKLRFGLKAKAQSEDEPEIELERSHAFIARGKCLDILGIRAK